MHLQIAAIIVAGIMIVTAALGTTPPPPRALLSEHTHAPEDHADQEHHSHGLTVQMSSNRRKANVTFASAHSGPNAVEIAVHDESGNSVEAQEVTFVAANPSAGVEPIRRTAVLLRPGVWEVKTLLLVPSGNWSITVEALVSDFEKPMFEGMVELR